jgi:hypothetical protein
MVPSTRQRFLRFASGLALALAFWSGFGVARADTPKRLERNQEGKLVCESTTECNGCGDEQVCRDVDGFDEYCAYPDVTYDSGERHTGELLCCESNEDCARLLDTDSARCVRDALEATSSGFCVSSEVQTCTALDGTVSLDVLRERTRKCLASSMTSVGQSWAKGDCDEDGVINAEDRCPCEGCEMSALCSERGCPAMPGDAGMPDASSGPDGGPHDAGSLDDAALAEPDAQPEPEPGPKQDAAGGIPMDASRSPGASEDSPGAATFTGDGGCRASGGRAPPGLAPSLILLALLTLRQGRRR